MLRIIHIITALHQGGAENQLEQLISASGDDVEHVVISLQSKKTNLALRLLKDGVRVYFVDFGSGGSYLTSFLKIRRYIRENLNCHTVIQCWMYHGNLIGTIASLGLIPRQKVFWNIRHSLHDIDKEKGSLKKIINIGRYFSFHPGAIIYNSRVSLYQHESYGYKSTNSTWIPNGFDLHKYRPDRNVRVSYKSQLKLPDKRVVIGHVARYSPMKNHAGFIKAICSLIDQGENVVALMVGRDVEAGNQELVSLIEDKYLGSFFLLGERSDIGALMKCMDIFCSSSSWGEAFPNVLGEAMATGLHCITTNVGDSAEIIGDMGVVVEPDDENALLVGLKDLVSSISMAETNYAARRRIADNFSLASVLAVYLKLYKDSLYH